MNGNVIEEGKDVRMGREDSYLSGGYKKESSGTTETKQVMVP